MSDHNETKDAIMEEDTLAQQTDRPILCVFCEAKPVCPGGNASVAYNCCSVNEAFSVALEVLEKYGLEFDKSTLKLMAKAATTAVSGNDTVEVTQEKLSAMTADVRLACSVMSRLNGQYYNNAVWMAL